MMDLILRNSNYLKLNKILVSFFLICISLQLRGQEFEWVYNTRGTNQNSYSSNSHVNQVITNGNNDIYIAGNFWGVVDFGDGEEGFVRNGDYSSPNGFVAKLDQDKNVIWVKDLKYGSYLISSILTDNNGNIIVSGSARPNGTSLFFNSNPENISLPNVLTPTHENLNTNKTYGFIYILDSDGNYIDSRLFEDKRLTYMVKDQTNTIVVVGYTVKYNVDIPSEDHQEWGYVAKLNTNLTTIWEKTFNNQDGNSNNGFTSASIDSQNNIYTTGSYANSFAFGTTVLQNNGLNRFVSKLSPNGDENYIIDFLNHPLSQIRVDESDNVYFFAKYSGSFSVLFNNVLVENLPVVQQNELVLFKMNTAGNLIWNVPIYGSGNQDGNVFAFNSLGELIVPVRVGMDTEFNYANQNTTIATYNYDTVILKIKTTGELIDAKGIYQNVPPDKVFTNTIHTDINDNILLGGFFTRTIDFDPHATNEYVLTPELFFNEYVGEYLPEQAGFVLKLKNCASIPFFDDTFEVCSTQYPNPTIADINPTGPNVKWYVSMGSTVQLTNDFQLTNGLTLYYENNVENCTNVGRFPLQVSILPPSSPPIISVVQPCYFQGMRLSDLDIQGQNLTFYLEPVGGESVGSDWVINPNSTYYVSQNNSNCESNRVSITVNQMSLLTSNHTAYICDADKDNYEIVNLSDYVQNFVGLAVNEFSFSYFDSHSDAVGNLNPISNFSAYQATNQTVYTGIYSSSGGCFKIVELNLNMVHPPEITKVTVDDLTNNNSITILPYDDNYSYSLDGINFQDSNYFDNLVSGEYFVFVRNNLADCLAISNEIYVMSYPNFFTPNGDGINDFWKVKYAQFQFFTDVEIYDRYGKFITVFNEKSEGWDGKYNEQEMPSTDYWFKIIRTTDKKMIYHGHFSLFR